MSSSHAQDFAALASTNGIVFRKLLHEKVTISESRELEIDPDFLHALDTTDKRVLVGAHVRILFEKALSLRKIATALSTERHKINHVKIQRKVDEIKPHEYVHAAIELERRPKDGHESILESLNDALEHRQFDETFSSLHCSLHRAVSDSEKETYDHLLSFKHVQSFCTRQSTKLSPFAEKCVAFLIVSMNKNNKPLLLKDVIDFANRLLQIENPDLRERKPITESWWNSFKKRNKSYGFCATVKVKPLDKTDTRSVETAEKHFFDDLERFQKDMNIPPYRVFNADQTHLNSDKSEKNLRVVGQRGTVVRSSLTTNLAKSLEHITVMFAVCASDEENASIVPPYTVYARQAQTSHLEKAGWEKFTDLPIPDDVFPLRSTKSGWFSQEVLDDWIDHFVKWTNCSPSNPALLLLDSARFHSKISPVTCGKRGLYVKILPAGRTWLLQPCDTNVFNHIKNSMARLERLQMSAQLSSSVVSRKSGPDQVDQNRSRLRCFEKFVAFVKKTLTSSEFPDETCSMQNREKWTTAEFHDPKNAAALVRAFSNSLRNEIDSARELPVRDSTTSTSSSSANSAARVGEKRSRESEVQAHRRVNSTGFVAGVTRHGPVRKVLKGRRLLRNQLFSRFFAVYFTTDFNAYP